VIDNLLLLVRAIMKLVVSMILRLIFVLLAVFSNASIAQPKENRVALVMGNSAYTSAPLKNPTNDAKDMAAKLKGMGFTVVERNNLTAKQIGSTLREFRSKLTPGSVALVYYAGHGLQIKGENYFPTVDAEITGEEDVPNQSLAMRQIMDVLEEAKTRLNLVFLDACRNNPYQRSFRSSSDGLSRVNAPSGTLISFATRPGSVAADGTGRNGLYTGALLEAMDSRGDQIEQVLKRVVTRVKAGSNNQQEPWTEGSIDGEFCFGSCLAMVSQAGMSDDRALWDSVKESRNVNEINAYLDKFPAGLFAGVARARVATIENLGSQIFSNSITPTGLPASNSAANQNHSSDFFYAVDAGVNILVHQEEKDAFDKAIAVFRQRDFIAAETAFSSFLSRNGASAYVPSALFWLGNAQYANKAYKESMANFQKLLSMAPNHPRAAESMLAISNIQIELKDMMAARQTLRDLINTHPQTNHATTASDRLKRLR
jgi:tol-pal system protein YbgF